ncbi:MAG: hypothetical protein QM703_09335 [Gemmatales bacterium]
MTTSNTRWWFLVLLAAFAGLLSSAVALPPVDWRGDWQAFVRELSPYLKREATPVEFKKAFDGKTVTWVGEVELVSLDGEYPYIHMKMPETKVPFPDGTAFEIDPILRPWNIKRTDATKWANLKPGDRVRFRTTLKERNSSHPAITLMYGAGGTPNQGKKFAFITTDGAELIEVIKAK